MACYKDAGKQDENVGGDMPISSNLYYFIVDSNRVNVFQHLDSITDSKILPIQNPYYITSVGDTFLLQLVGQDPVFKIAENPTYIRNERKVTGTDTLTRIVFYNNDHKGDTMLYYNECNTVTQIFFQYNDSVFTPHTCPYVDLKLLNL